MKNTTILILILFMTSCKSTKYLKFSQKQDEIFTTENLKDYLKSNKNPRVVLRVNNSSLTVTEDESIDYLYNAIEGKLLSNNFKVRDRQLFNKIITNQENTINYKELGEKSETDLIIELAKLDYDIEYETNQYYNKKDKLKVEPDGEYIRYGAEVEFKVVQIENNEYAGLYTFHYTPCSSSPCVIQLSPKDERKAKEKMLKAGEEPYEGVEQDVLEEFMKNATQQLINSMRN